MTENWIDRVSVVRSARRTISLRIAPDGSIECRAPRSMSMRAIRAFLLSRSAWVEKTLEKVRRTEAQTRPLSPAELDALAQRAKQVIPPRVAHYAALLGVTYGRITVRCQKTRWGSCSAKGNLNFNCLLMLAPESVLDSVIVHELCHRLEMNHSPRFYAHVYRILPDYDARHRWLKEHGAALLAGAAAAKEEPDDE